MLVLSRRKGQRITICDQDGRRLAEITVAAVHRSSVKLAIQAPPTLVVTRAELAPPLAKTTPPPPPKRLA